MNLLLKLKEWMGFEFGDVEPMNDWCRKMDRRWRWRPQAGLYEGRVYFGWDMQLVQYQGKRDAPRTVGDWQMQLFFDPRRWVTRESYKATRKFGLWEIWHGYYDGPHCFWRLGPLAVMRHEIGWCLKCMPESS
jgi:hypothetical protein